MKIHRLVLSGLLALLILAAVGLVLTNSWTNTASRKATTQSSSQASLVDQQPLQTAQQLANYAVTSDEKQYAQEALRLSDNEVDLTFSYALREAVRHPAFLSADAKALEARIQRRQARLDAEGANIARMTQMVAKAPASKKDELQQELALAQAQASLGQDELDDSKQDLIRAGGDQRSKIQEMLQEHEQSEVHNNKESATANGNEASIENTASRNVIAEFHAWKSLNAKQQQLEAARQNALNRAYALAQSHEALDKAIQAQQNPAWHTPGKFCAGGGSACACAKQPGKHSRSDFARSQTHRRSKDARGI